MGPPRLASPPPLPPPPVQAYASNYTGHARMTRLLFVADRSQSRELELDALKLLHDQVKKVRARVRAWARGLAGGRARCMRMPPRQRGTARRCPMRLDWAHARRARRPARTRCCSAPPHVPPRAD